MTRPPNTGLRLDLPSGETALTSLLEIDAVLAGVGTSVWPLDLGSAPADVRVLLSQPTLTEAEVERVNTHCTLAVVMQGPTVGRSASKLSMSCSIRC
jgi:hypothetical protein